MDIKHRSVPNSRPPLGRCGPANRYSVHRAGHGGKRLSKLEKARAEIHTRDFGLCADFRPAQSTAWALEASID
jgi:hypothetical protein